MASKEIPFFLWSLLSAQGQQINIGGEGGREIKKVYKQYNYLKFVSRKGTEINRSNVQIRESVKVSMQMRAEQRTE